jgi:DNA-binding GntR family transcriptional regulator
MALIESRILTDHVYDKIRLMIEDGVLKPGAKINKRELEIALGVSQTPINDALSRLSGQKIIEQRSRRGYFVRDYSCKELIDIFAARAAVEGMAARLCVDNATDEGDRRRSRHCSPDVSFPLDDEAYHEYEMNDRTFHSRVILYSRNQMIAEMNEQFGYIVKAATKGLIRPPEDTIDEHRAIVAALRARDARLAGELMTEHHMNSREVLKSSCTD